MPLAYQSVKVVSGSRPTLHRFLFFEGQGLRRSHFEQLRRLHPFMIRLVQLIRTSARVSLAEGQRTGTCSGLAGGSVLGDAKWRRPTCRGRGRCGGRI